MKVADMVFRLYVETDQFESTIAFYETAQAIACELKFAAPFDTSMSGCGR